MSFRMARRTPTPEGGASPRGMGAAWPRVGSGAGRSRARDGVDAAAAADGSAGGRAGTLGCAVSIDTASRAHGPAAIQVQVTTANARRGRDATKGGLAGLPVAQPVSQSPCGKATARQRKRAGGACSSVRERCGIDRWETVCSTAPRQRAAQAWRDAPDAAATRSGRGPASRRHRSVRRRLDAQRQRAFARRPAQPLE
jgi:hypothetical protein